MNEIIKFYDRVRFALLVKLAVGLGKNVFFPFGIISNAIRYVAVRCAKRIHELPTVFHGHLILMSTNLA
jgi:hypothetical protein